ncbi:MAG: SDR family oxidoreductase [Minisyncoccia bacterium]
MKRNIVITGGSSGIGYSLTKRLTENGDNVFLLSRKALDAKINGENCFKIPCDVSKTMDINRAKDDVLRILSGLENSDIDCLINCAGVGYEKSLENTDESDFEYIFGTNVKGLIFTTKIFLPLLSKPNSVICNISSVAGIKGFAGWTLYSASKFAVEGFSESLRHELRPKRIKVISVRLGAVNTPFYKDLPNDDKTEFMDPGEVSDTIIMALFTGTNAVVENIFINNTCGDL